MDYRLHICTKASPKDHNEDDTDFQIQVLFDPPFLAGAGDAVQTALEALAKAAVDAMLAKLKADLPKPPPPRAILISS